MGRRNGMLEFIKRLSETAALDISHCTETLLEEFQRPAPLSRRKVRASSSARQVSAQLAAIPSSRSLCSTQITDSRIRIQSFIRVILDLPVFRNPFNCLNLSLADFISKLIHTHCFMLKY